MQPRIDKISSLTGEKGVDDFESIFKARPFSPFSTEVIAFLSDLSSRLMQNREARNYPDVITFAFWCRRGGLLALQSKFSSSAIRLGRGVAFHISPSNVPVNFAYSMAAGLLAGNANIVRVPSKMFPQVELISSAVGDLLHEPEHKAIAHHISLIRYERDETINAWFSSNCDIRIIWGGDATISEIRKAPLPPRSFDVTFADRYSICAIHASNYLKNGDSQAIARGFYNDTYLFDQNACTAPHLVLWIGETDDIVEAKAQFWSKLHSIASAEYNLAPISSIDKYTKFLELAEKNQARLDSMPDALIVRAKIDSLFQEVDEFRCATGYFIEYDAKCLGDIATIVSRKYQTLSYYGFDVEELSGLVKDNRLVGIDRIVPIGHTMDFSLLWDGHDLIRTLSRTCEVL